MLIRPIKYNFGNATVCVLADVNHFGTKFARETYNPLNMMGPAKGMLRRTLEDAIRQAEEWMGMLKNLAKMGTDL